MNVHTATLDITMDRALEASPTAVYLTATGTA
jgi:hypothetical protein